MLKLVEMFAAAILVVTMLASSLSRRSTAKPHGIGHGCKWPDATCRILPRQIGPCQLVELLAQVAVRCPSGLDVVCEGQGHAGSCRWPLTLSHPDGQGLAGVAFAAETGFASRLPTRADLVISCA